MKKQIISAGILIAVYAIYKTYQIVNPNKDLDKIIAGGGIVPDVRTKAEYEQGHINGSINIPLSQLYKGTISIDTGYRSLPVVLTD